MALHKVNPLSDNPEGERRSEAPCVASCPVCDGKMEVVYQRNNQTVCVCADCHTGVTVPGQAWDIARIKREAKWMPKP